MRIENVHPLEIISDIIVDEMNDNKYLNYGKIKEIITRKNDYEFVTRLAIYNHNHEKRTASFKNIHNELWEDFIEDANPYDKIASIYKNYMFIKKLAFHDTENDINDILIINNNFSVNFTLDTFKLLDNPREMYRLGEFLIDLNRDIIVNEGDSSKVLDIIITTMAMITQKFNKAEPPLKPKTIIDAETNELIENTKVKYNKSNQDRLEFVSFTSDDSVIVAYDFIYKYFIKKCDASHLFTKRLNLLGISPDEFEKIEIPSDNNEDLIDIHPLDLIAGLIQNVIEAVMEKSNMLDDYTKDTIIRVFRRDPMINYFFNKELKYNDSNYLTHVVYGLLYTHDHKYADIAKKVIDEFPDKDIHDIIMKIFNSYDEIFGRILVIGKAGIDGTNRAMMYNDDDLIYARLLLCDYSMKVNIKTLDVSCDDMENIKNKYMLFKSIMNSDHDKEQVLKDIALIIFARASMSPFIDKLIGVTNSDCDTVVDEFFHKIHQLSFDDIENMIKIKKYTHFFRDNLGLLGPKHINNYGIKFPLNADDIIDTAVKIYTLKFKSSLHISYLNDMKMINRREDDLPMSVDMFYELDTRFHFMEFLLDRKYDGE